MCSVVIGDQGPALVRQHDHPVAQRADVAGMTQRVLRHLALAELRVGQAPGHRHPLGDAEQIQLQPQYQRECARQ
jgi:hypothetical protein